jgi:hypothetical protein
MLVIDGVTHILNIIFWFIYRLKQDGAAECHACEKEKPLTIILMISKGYFLFIVKVSEK